MKEYMQLLARQQARDHAFLMRRIKGNTLFVGYRMMKQLASTKSTPKEVYRGIKNKDACAVGLLSDLFPIYHVN